MRRIAGALAMIVLPVWAGCAQNPLAQNAAPATSPQQTALTQQNKDLQARATTLDRDNQELESLLAQNRQQTRLLEDQLTALRGQLSATANQLAQARQDKSATEQKVQAYAASTRVSRGASITANNSLRDKLAGVNLPGVEVREDGDVIRVELQADKLFDIGTARMRAGAAVLIDGVAAELMRAFPEQIIGIEGHTDTSAVVGGQYPNNHQLSLARASAVFDLLTQRGRMRPEQLFIVGDGANHPVVSNATPAGQARNRRIELVVYPEKRE